MDNKSSGRKDSFKKYSGIYRNMKNKRRNRNFNFFKYILAFLFIATLTYFSCMAIYSFVNREHVSEVVVPENYDIKSDNKNVEPLISQPPKAAETPVSDSPADVNIEPISAIELPKKYIFNNNAFKEFIKIAKRKGKNAIVVLLKDEAGKLLYKSNTDLAKAWKTCVKDAVLANNIAEEIKKEGLIPIAKLNAFLDNTAPDPSRENTFLAPNENSSNKKENIYMFKDGAERVPKKWLNPCCDVTKKYILDLVKEVCSLGFSYVLLENMRFADTEFSFSLGDGNMVDKAEVLKSFVKDLNNTGAKFIISYDIGAISDEDRAINCFGGDISKYNIKYQAPIVGLSGKIGEDVGFYENLITNLKSKRYGIVFIPKVELKDGVDEFVSFLKEKSLDSSIVLY